MQTSYSLHVTGYIENRDIFVFVVLNDEEHAEACTMPAGLFAKLVGETGNPDEFVGRTFEVKVIA